MGTTPNLGLPVYGSSNTPDWMDTNNGFEKLDNIVGGAAGVQLDFANPLYTFDSTHTSYTAVSDCYLFGTLWATDNKYGKVLVDGQPIAVNYTSQGNYCGTTVPITRIKKGSVITCTDLPSSANADRIALSVYNGEIISDTFVWNEAIVELDYANPLYTFTAGGSYTCEKRCWMIGSSMNTAVSVNGNRIADGSSGYYSNIPLTPLSKGDVINVTTGGSGINILVLDGTIKGSAPGNGGGGDVLELLDFDNAVELSTTAYTAPKAGAILGELRANSTSSQYLYIDNVIVASGSGTSSDAIPLQYYGIQKGSVIKLAQAQYNGGSGIPIKFVPYKYESIAPEITVYNEAEVELDYANPLHAFTSGNFTYTATKTCYLCGDLDQNNAILSINNTAVVRGWYGTGYVGAVFIPPLKINAGDVVKVDHTCERLHIFDGTISGSVGQLNPAPKPDYNNCLYEASPMVSSGTYTATQDCYVRCGGENSQDGVGYYKVNDHVVNKVYGPITMFSQCELDLQKGDVLTWSNIGTLTGYVSVFAYR